MYRTDKQFMKDPATASSRIFIGNIAESVVPDNLEQKFRVHGRILGLVLQRGFGFIQFDRDEEAQSAIEKENGQTFHGRKLTVKQAYDNKSRNKPPNQNMPNNFNNRPGPPMMNRPFQDRPMQNAPPSPHLQQQQQQPPPNQPPPSQHQQQQQHPHQQMPPFQHPPTPPQQKPPFMSNQQQGAPAPLRPPPPPLNQMNQNNQPPPRMTDNMMGGPMPGDKRPPPDLQMQLGRNKRRRPLLRRPDMMMPPMRDDQTYYGRDDPFGLPQDGPRPERNDCEIIVVSKALTEYAEYIEQRLKNLGLIVDLLFPNEDVPLGKVLANISSRGCLFAILVMPQNEEHRSLTLDILHGVPEEHRNIPLEDALLLIIRNFEAYMRGEQTTAPQNQAKMVLADRHPESMQCIFNLLAENRQITATQYDKLIKYLLERRELQLQFEATEAGENPTEESTTKEAELQSRIMNILNNKAATSETTVMQPKPETTKQESSTPTPLLNDPSVQKALDSLLLGDMFKSITTAS